MGMAAANSFAKEPGITAKVIAAVVGRVLRLRSGGGETAEQKAQIVQLLMDTAPIAIKGMMENLPPELQGQVLAAYRDENDEIQWDYFPASEVKKGELNL